ncbi:transposase [Alishewanella sp. HL-SH06]|uniref:transposase n=1 Tax=Alishewanella sp. HL-SH06 TaxID=3461144 RepID=UPI0040421ADA
MMRPKTSQTHARGNTEPWLLASNLPQSSHHSKQVVSIYRQRMLIEESFRDIKSMLFGLRFEQNGSTKIHRISLLPLQSHLAALALILLDVGY